MLLLFLLLCVCVRGCVDRQVSPDYWIAAVLSPDCCVNCCADEFQHARLFPTSGSRWLLLVVELFGVLTSCCGVASVPHLVPILS
ncbi:hypothetical protein ILYODFUR_008022 [Ilyodon furcidens]|uniref:Secreted protein n=1 Tax=Ilyodon furcidens TaxID=33524 RepID=A0ABV0TUK9_9TELE